MAFMFRLEQEDGTPADPPWLNSAVPNWRPADTLALGPSRMLRVVAVRDDDADQPPSWSSKTWPGRPLASKSHS
jgi:hypothetical protein